MSAAVAADSTRAITEPTRAILERLGLDPQHVRALTLDATKPYVDVTLYHLNDDGAHHLDERGEVALTTTRVELPRRLASRHLGSIFRDEIVR